MKVYLIMSVVLIAATLVVNHLMNFKTGKAKTASLWIGGILFLIGLLFLPPKLASALVSFAAVVAGFLLLVLLARLLRRK